MTGLRERNKDKRRTAILDATMALLRDREFTDVTVEQVAARAEVSPNTVYNLVGTKDQIVTALIRRLVRRMVESPPDDDEDVHDPAAALRRLTGRGVDAVLADPIAYRRALRAVSSVHSSGAGRVPLEGFELAAASLAAHGVLRDHIDPRVVARHALFGMYGALMSWAHGTTADSLRTDASASLSLVLAGTTTGAVAERAAEDIVRLGQLDNDRIHS